MTIEIIQQLGAYISQHILMNSEYEIEKDEALISGGLIDSFSLIDLAIFIEKTWGVKIADVELNAGTFDTLIQLAQLIEQKTES